jgi:hypothetical protein
MNARPATQPAVYFKPERNARKPWFAVVSETTNGKRRRVWSPGQSSKAEAKAWAWAYKRDGKPEAPAAPAPMTFGVWLDKWLAQHDAGRVPSSGGREDLRMHPGDRLCRRGE